MARLVSNVTPGTALAALLLAPWWLVADVSSSRAEDPGVAKPVPAETLTVRGEFEFSKKWKPTAGQMIDARQARWRGDERGWGIQIIGGDEPGVVLLGPTIHGPLDLAKVEDWNKFHHSAGIYLKGLPKFTLRDAKIGDAGDGVRIRGECPDWTIEGCYIRSAGDDAIENDDLQSGRILDCLIERSHVGISLRPARDDEATIDGSENVLEIRDSLIRVAPQRATFINDGFTEGHGGFFKFWTREGSEGRRIQLKIENCIFCAESLPYTSDLSLDPAHSVLEAKGNTIVWLGTGEFPENVPPGWLLSRDRAVWDNGVAAWKRRHGIAEPVVAKP